MLPLTRSLGGWAAPIARVLARRPIGVLCDVDGTLSPIAPTPDAARVPGGIRAALRNLAGRVAVIAAVSGRPAHQVAGLLDLPHAPGFVIVGNHGFEMYRGGRLTRPPDLDPYLPVLAGIADRARAELTLPGIFVEDKTATLSLHYRGTADLDAAQDAVLRWAHAAAGHHGLKVTQGRRVVEIRPPLDYDKGRAVLGLIDDYDLRGVIYLGDDLTDLDAFEALRAWRADPGRAAAIVAVTGAEAPPEVCDAADLCLEDIEEVEALLRRLAEFLSGAGEQ